MFYLDEITTKSVESTLNELKEKEISSAIIRQDGIIISSNFQFEDAGVNAISTIANTSDALLKQFKDKQKEMEIVLGNTSFFIVHIGVFMLCTILKNKDQKQLVRDCAVKLKAELK